MAKFFLGTKLLNLYLKNMFLRIQIVVNGILDFLSGKKAYIIGGFAIALGLIYQDKDLVMVGFSTITLRAGISKLK